MGGTSWKRFLATGLGGVAFCALTRGDLQASVGVAVQVASVIAVVLAIRTWKPEHSRAWYCFVAGGSSVVLGGLILAAHRLLAGVSNPFPSPADAFFILGYAALIAGEVILVRRRSADIEGDNLVDSLILVSCLGVLVSAYVLVPYVQDPELGSSEKVLSSVYSVLVLVVVGVAARLAVGSGRRNPSYYFLAASFAFLVLADVLTTLGTAEASRSGPAIVCSAMAYVLFATGALHPSMARLTDRPADREIQLTRRRLLLLIAALLAVPVALATDSILGERANVAILAAGSVPLSVLVLLRLADLVRAKERKAARERIVREAGASLVAATTRKEMHDAALEAALALVATGPDARVSIMDGAPDDLQVVASGGSGADEARSGGLISAASLPAPVHQAFRQHRLVVLERAMAFDLQQSNAAPVDRTVEAGEERSVLVVPLASRNEVRGALFVASQRVLKSEVQRALEALASQLSLALESAALTEQVHQRRQERRFRALVENSSALVSVVGSNGRVSFVSPSAERLLGVPESALLDKHPFSRIHAEDRYRACALLDRAWAVPGVCEPIEARFRHGNGDWRWFEVVVDNLVDEPEVRGIVIHARDVTDRKVAQGRLEASEARFRSLVQHASDVVIVLDDDLRMAYLSPSVERVLGYATEKLAGSPWLDIVHPDDALHACRLTGQGVTRPSMELRFRRRDGSRLILDMTVTDLRHDPAVKGIVLNGRDVTERRELEKQLRHQALHDALTELANRTLFIDRVEHSLSRRAQRRGLVAVLLIDLDDFKTVNDGFGEAAGDALLKQVATRLQGCLSSGDTAARIGGDQFSVLLEDVGQKATVLQAAEHIQSALREPFSLGDRELRVTPSIGIAFDAGEAASAEALVRDADVALHLAKSRGKDRYQVFEVGMRTDLFERLRLKSEMAVGLDRHEFALHYQPVVGLSSGELVGVEALLRWQHPARGLLSPETFISIAEETGYIVPLGRWVLEKACAQLQAWRSEHPGLVLGLSVNVSVRQLESPGLLTDVRKALKHSGIDPPLLTLEITETMLMADVEMVCRQLRRLKKLGVGLAVDDFGTGYSSLGYLQRFPLDAIKIDRSFVEPLGRRAQQADVVRAIIDLAATLGLRTVAEGIQRPQAITALQAMGCDAAQGNHFCEAVPEGEITRLLSAGTARAFPVAIRAASPADN